MPEDTRRTNLLRAVLACAAALAPGRAAAQRALPPLDSVIAHYVAARGGLAAIRGVRTERLVGTITFPGGAAAADTVELARPGRVRTTIHVPRGAIIQAYDGRTAWGMNALAGDTAPRALDPGTAANVIAGGDLDGPLVDRAAKGNRVALVGVDTADGRAAWALRVTRPDGTEDVYFVDTASSLEVKWQGRRVLHGAPVVFETLFRDYRLVDGVRLPFRIESRTVGRPGAVRIAFDSVAVNVPIAGARFAMPPGAPR